MARVKRDATIENRTNRLKLAPRPEPTWTRLENGRHLGYRRVRDGAGTWVARFYDPQAKPPRRYQALGSADDFADANGTTVLAFDQAQRAARAWFKVAEREAALISGGETLHEGPFTVGHAMEEYLAEQNRRGKKGAARAELAIKAHILPALGDVPLSKLTPGRLKRWLHALAEAPRMVRTKMGEPRATGKAPVTEDEKRARRDSANRVWTSLRAALNLALQSGHVQDGSAWAGVKGFEGTTRARIRYLTIPEQVRLVNACPPDLRRLVTGALHTGARYGELVSLRVADFDEAAGAVHVAAHVSKTGKARNIILTQEGRDFFATVSAGRRGDDRVFVRDVDVKRRKHDATGSAWGRGDQRRPLEAACEAAEIARCTFHELRHTAASTWINAGMSLGDVAEQLGDTERTTAKHYIHLCPDARAARLRAVAPHLGINVGCNVASLKVGG